MRCLVGESPEGSGFQLKGLTAGGPFPVLATGVPLAPRTPRRYGQHSAARRGPERLRNILVDPFGGLAYDTLLELVMGEIA